MSSAHYKMLGKASVNMFRGVQRAGTYQAELRSCLLEHGSRF